MDTPKIQKTAFYAKCCLCRVFKSVMSVTPTEYINSKRLEYSVYLLTQTSKEIIEISMLCGFSSLSHFYHLFKKKYQSPPSRFRKMNGNYIQDSSPKTTGTDL